MHYLICYKNDEPKNNNRKTIYTHQHRASLVLFTFWWCHNWLCNSGDDVTNDLVIVTRAWKLISNSLDIVLIHGDIHDRSCKNHQFPNFKLVQLMSSGKSRRSGCKHCNDNCKKWKSKIDKCHMLRTTSIHTSWSYLFLATVGLYARKLFCHSFSYVLYIYIYIYLYNNI